MLYRWKRSDRNPAEGESMCVDEREELKPLRKEGFSIGRYKVRNLMKKLNLKVTQRIACKVIMKRNYSDGVADSL